MAEAFRSLEVNNWESTECGSSLVIRLRWKKFQLLHHCTRQGQTLITTRNSPFEIDTIDYCPTLVIGYGVLKDITVLSKEVGFGIEFCICPLQVASVQSWRSHCKL